MKSFIAVLVVLVAACSAAPLEMSEGDLSDFLSVAAAMPSGYCNYNLTQAPRSNFDYSGKWFADTAVAENGGPTMVPPTLTCNGLNVTIESENKVSIAYFSKDSIKGVKVKTLEYVVGPSGRIRSGPDANGVTIRQYSVFEDPKGQYFGLYTCISVNNNNLYGQAALMSRSDQGVSKEVREAAGNGLMKQGWNLDNAVTLTPYKDCSPFA